MARSNNRVLASIFFLALSWTLISLSQPAQAVTAELFFSEYIEGSSNNKALEIYNGTGLAVDLAAGGYNVQMYFNGSSTAGLTINLTGVVANGDVYVLAHSSASSAILAQADQTNSSGWFNGNDAMVLLKGTTIIDVIGQIGLDPGTEWGTGLTSTADNTLRRKSNITGGDTNGSDFFDPSVEWDGFATDTFSGLGSHSLLTATWTIDKSVTPDTLYLFTGDSATVTYTISVVNTTPSIHDTIHVNDSNGGLFTFNESGSVSYTKTYSCDGDQGTHNNIATIEETGQSDDASVTVNCYSVLSFSGQICYYSCNIGYCPPSHCDINIPGIMGCMDVGQVTYCGCTPPCPPSSCRVLIPSEP
jgi:predicted extracellular nuclease